MSEAVPLSVPNKIILAYGIGSPVLESLIVPDIFSDNKNDDRRRMEITFFIIEFREIKNRGITLKMYSFI